MPVEIKLLFISFGDHLLAFFVYFLVSVTLDITQTLVCRNLVILKCLLKLYDFEMVQSLRGWLGVVVKPLIPEAEAGLSYVMSSCLKNKTKLYFVGSNACLEWRIRSPTENA